MVCYPLTVGIGPRQLSPSYTRPKKIPAIANLKFSDNDTGIFVSPEHPLKNTREIPHNGSFVKDIIIFSMLSVPPQPGINSPYGEISQPQLGLELATVKQQDQIV
jgi:hypothetical protein